MAKGTYESLFVPPLSRLLAEQEVRGNITAVQSRSSDSVLGIDEVKKHPCPRTSGATFSRNGRLVIFRLVRNTSNVGTRRF